MSNNNASSKMSDQEPDVEEYSTKQPVGDEVALQELGYDAQMRRDFSLMQLVGSAFTLTNSWLGIAAGFTTGFTAAGPASIIYGLILMFLLNIFVGIALSELISAMPTSSGQYYWAMRLAPKSISRVSGYITGVCNMFGAYCVAASTSIGVSMWIFGCIKLAIPEYALTSWHVYLGAVALNILAAIVNLWSKAITKSVLVGLWLSLLTCVAIIIALPAGAHAHTDAKFIFGTFVNSSGWSSDAMTFLTGLISTNWCFGVLDSAAHLAEETPSPERNVPKAIMFTVIIGFCTAFPLSCVILYSLTEYDRILNTPTGLPLLEVLYVAFGSKPKALAAAAFITCSYFVSLFPQHTYQARICWSFARDNGVPFSSFFSRVHAKNNVPLNAHFLSVGIVILLGLIYIASSTAFNSLITGLVTFPYITYIIPMASSIWRGTKQPKGPFNLGRLGAVAKGITVVFCLFTLIIYSFPFIMPATGSNMNYITVIYGIAAVYGLFDWFLRARLSFCNRGHGEVGATTDMD